MHTAPSVDDGSRALQAGKAPGRVERRTSSTKRTPSYTSYTPTIEAVALVEEFAATQPYALDPFQREATAHLASGRSVLVAAPTGTGKTVVAEAAIWLAQRAGERAIYTAPVKALSNQKFRDLRALYGPTQVGLMTGDIVENPSAPIVVMTTEIYRNMLLEGLRAAHTSASHEEPSIAEEADALLSAITQRASAPGGGLRPQAAALPSAADVAELARRARLDEELSSVGCVIFDELHYLNDPERGPVWEEAIIHSPPHVTFVGLSATVSNADELRHWIEEVHGPMALVYHAERAIPLEHYYFLDDTLHLVQNAAGQRVERFPKIGGEAKLARMFGRGRRFITGSYGRYGPNAVGAPSDEVNDAGKAGEAGATRNVGNAGPDEEDELPPEHMTPRPAEVITALRNANLLPCLYFLPGRRAVEAAADGAATHLLVSLEQRARLATETQAWIRTLPPEEQRLEQAQRLLLLLPRGIGFHHAGLLPALKVMVETLFARGELRVVFSTDTLALGINMPARSVVVGSLSKFDGIQMRLMTPNEYQQLTGRAGRRGMDEKGAAVIPYSPWEAFEPSFAALTGPLEPVTSAFNVRYNTVLNLWRAGDLDRLRHAVAASLREYQRHRVAAYGAVSLRRGGRNYYAEDDEDDLRAYYEPGHPSQKQKAGKGGKHERRRERQGPGALSNAATAELNATIYVMRAFGYIGRDDELTLRGRLLRAIFHPAGILLCELILGGALDTLDPSELAEVFSWFTFDNDRSLRNLATLPDSLRQVRRIVYRVLRDVQEFEDSEGLAMTPGIVDGFHSVALNWARGFTLATLLKRIDLAEGDLLVSLNQTIDLLQQAQSAVSQALDARDLWRDTSPTRSGKRANADERRTAQQEAMRQRLEALRPRLTQAWRLMLRGSVAMSRALPSMTVTPLTGEPEAAVSAESSTEAEAILDTGVLPPEPPDAPPIIAAEDSDPIELQREREEDVVAEVEEVIGDDEDSEDNDDAR